MTTSFAALLNTSPPMVSSEGLCLLFINEYDLLGKTGTLHRATLATRGSLDLGGEELEKAQREAEQVIRQEGFELVGEWQQTPFGRSAELVKP